MGERKLHGLIVILVIICGRTSSGLSKNDARIRMINNLGPDTILDIHCIVNGQSKGHQHVPYKWSCQWWFKLDFPTLMQREVNTKGAKQLLFMGFAMDSSDSCHYDGAGNCYWQFTAQGMFQKRSGEWVFRFKWPH